MFSIWAQFCSPSHILKYTSEWGFFIQVMACLLGKEPGCYVVLLWHLRTWGLTPSTTRPTRNLSEVPWHRACQDILFLSSWHHLQNDKMTFVFPKETRLIQEIQNFRCTKRKHREQWCTHTAIHLTVHPSYVVLVGKKAFHYINLSNSETVKTSRRPNGLFPDYRVFYFPWRGGKLVAPSFPTFNKVHFTSCYLRRLQEWLAFIMSVARLYLRTVLSFTCVYGRKLSGFC